MAPGAAYRFATANRDHDYYRDLPFRNAEELLPLGPAAVFKVARSQLEIEA
jgi:hypothetical protein